jgi:hypothetical protein
VPRWLQEEEGRPLVEFFGGQPAITGRHPQQLDDVVPIPV